MKRTVTILMAILWVSISYAQNEVRSLEDFSTLKISNALEVVLTKGDKNEVEIIASDAQNYEKVKAEVSNEQLNIYTTGKMSWGGDIKILLTYKDLRGVQQSGASELRATNSIKADKFYLKGSGAIEASLNVEVNELMLDFSGASELNLAGTVNLFKVNLSGASDLKASNLLAKNIEIDVSGASDIKVNASESISGKATGASSVTVKGSPKIRAINKSGASSTNFNNNSSYRNNVEGLSIGVGKGKVVVTDDEDVDVQLGNKQVLVNGDTTKVKWGATNLFIVGDSVWTKRIVVEPRRNHWAGIDLGINGFLNANNSFNLSNDASLAMTNPEKVTQFMELNYSKSWTFSINFMEFFFKIKDHHFGFVTGMGTEWSNYELKHNVRLDAKGGANVFDEVNEFNENYTWGEIDTVLDYSKNRFKTWFINVPLLLELNTGTQKNKSFHISAGAILGFNLQTKIKYKYRIDGDTKKEKDKQSFNTNPLRASLTTRMGYNWFNVFATYSLTQLFEDGRGPELYPFTVGVTLLGF